ncbi:MAG TPA: hypothetical protein VEQ60_30670 [Longimicrobium sp.]|nr:hypothetical protein [Longimicrobium sp.]
MKRFIYGAMLCTAVLAPRAAQAQDAPERPTSLSLSPFGTTTIGVWHWFSPRTEAGLQIGGSFAGREEEEGVAEDRRTTFTIEPAVKLYGASRGDLRPYGAGTVFVNSQKYEYAGPVESETFTYGVSLGGGLEWSPAPRVRIGGHAGVRVARLDGNHTYVDIDTPVERGIEGWEASTFTTGLTVYYSF